MKRLGRLGSMSFMTITISLVFHLIAMSSDSWVINTCINCDLNNTFATWHTTLRQRCYQSSIGALFVPASSPLYNEIVHAFIANICLPNQILMAKKREYAYDCLQTAMNATHLICTIPLYNPNECECQYPKRIQAILAMTILTALSLGILVFIAHNISHISLDYILRWLFPLAFGLLGFAVICTVITLAIFGGSKNEDVNELVFLSTLLQQTFLNATLVEEWKQELAVYGPTHYSVKIGWCFGMEVLSLQFLIVTLILFILMYMAKNRPEPEN